MGDFIISFIKLQFPFQSHRFLMEEISPNHIQFTLFPLCYNFLSIKYKVLIIIYIEASIQKKLIPPPLGASGNKTHLMGFNLFHFFS
tara:strand:- start:160920 stop:161180 length:261 start_codon:yes stop_codon:yes gene_type:complete